MKLFSILSPRGLLRGLLRGLFRDYEFGDFVVGGLWDDFFVDEIRLRFVRAAVNDLLGVGHSDDCITMSAPSTRVGFC
jgi:hypothetical protein